MYVLPDEFPKTYQQIRTSSVSRTSCRVVILVSCLDIDALCSARILDGLLKTELIPHKILPVVGYQDLKSAFNELDEEVRNVILLGCGATLDLDRFLEIKDDSRKIHVIDNHRPWNLDNLFASRAVVCWDDGPVGKPEFEVLKASLRLDVKYTEHISNNPGAGPHNFVDSDESEDSEGSRDLEDSQDRSGSEDVGDPENSENPEGLEDLGTSESTRQPLKRPRPNTGPGSKKRFKKPKLDWGEKLDQYYAKGTYYGASASTQIYALLSQIGETNIGGLWLTIVGSSMLDCQSPQVFASLYPILRNEVLRLSSTRNKSLDPATKSSSAAADDTSIAMESDYSLFLLRHWSLYESMLHSSYLSAKLTLWHEDGRKRLHKMLARLGIALSEAKESWVHMAGPVKSSLREKLSSVSDIFGIDGIIKQGFLRRYGFRGSISAGDTVQALTALLEVGRQSNPDNLKMPVLEEAKIEDNLLVQQKFWVSNFWAAWDALSDVNELLHGIDLAKVLQRVVTTTATALFEKKQIKNLRRFRLAVLMEGPNLAFFQNPLALTRLGAWIAEGCAESTYVPLPLVMAALDVSSGTYLVLGMSPHRPREAHLNEEGTDYEWQFNEFGPAFQAVAAHINSKVRVDAFESSVIQVAKEELSRFLEALTTQGMD